MRTRYLIYSFIAFIAYAILHSINNQIKWIALGFGVTMFLFGVFSKPQIKIKEENDEEKENDEE